MKYAFKIGEIAKLYGIGADTIRYYEEQGLISPRRDTNGYRMYSIRDIWRMNVIRDLRGLGFSVERIREYLNDRSVETTLRLLEEEKEAVEQKIARLKAQKKNVEQRICTIQESADTPFGVVEKVYLEDRRCHEIVESFSSDEEVDLLMKRLLNLNPDRLYLIGSNNIGCRVSLSSIEEPTYSAYTAAFLIDADGEALIPAGQYLRLRYRGKSSNTFRLIPRLAAYAQKHQYQLAGDILELVWIDIHEASDVREHITELQVRVTPQQ